MTLASPLYLLLLIPFAIIFLLLAKGRIGRDATMIFSDVNLLKKGSVRRRSFEPFRAVRFLARFLPVLLFIAALSRPQTTTIEQHPVGQTTEIIFAVDSSSTMYGGRMGNQSRLEAVKDEIAKFVNQRPYDRFGLVSFSRRASTLCPVTEDHKTFLRALDALTGDATATGHSQGLALATAVNRLSESAAPVRVIVMLSDGANTPSEIEPHDAAQAAWALGINVYTVGVGAAGTPIVPAVKPVYQPGGPEKGQTFDEQSLFQMARSTGGVYFRAKDLEALAEVFHEINLLEQYQLSTERIAHHTEYFPWLAWPGLVFLMGYTLLDRILFRKLP